MTIRTFTLALGLAVAATGAFAAEHEIRMLNKGEAGAMVFEPSFLRVEPGDSVHFVEVDKGHNAETIPGLIPDGAEPFKGKLNQDVTVTLTVPGLYGVKCLPHFTMGMAALIQVGDASVNLEAAKAVKLPKKAQERLESAFSQVK